MRMRNWRKDRYRDVVTIQEDRSHDGEEQENWKLFGADIHCKVIDINGMSSYRGVQLEETVSTVVEMHYLEGLKPDMRIQYTDRAGKRTLNIKSVIVKRSGSAREKHWAFCDEVVV